MGHNVRAMFRVLGVEVGYTGLVTAHIAPTYSTRDGKECEENKSFSRWTPSGNGEIRADPESAIRPLLQPGSYLYLDICEGIPELDASPEAVRTLWGLDKVEVHASQFTPSLYLVRDERGEAINNPAIGGRGGPGGSLSMAITNLACWPMFVIVPKDDGRDRLLTIDFSPA